MSKELKGYWVDELKEHRRKKNLANLSMFRYFVDQLESQRKVIREKLGYT